MTITTEQIQAIAATGTVVTATGDTIGSISQVYRDDSTGVPTWVTVPPGAAGGGERFVPLSGAQVLGDRVVVAFDAATIASAPAVEPDGAISPAEEQQLYRHYGLAAASGDGESRAATGAGPVGRDTSGPTTGAAMTRSEERLRVGVQRRVSGRAVLRKYVITETVTQTIQVRREEVRLEVEPVGDADQLSLADDQPALADEVYEVILHKEVPVVQIDVVPVERVRLVKEVITEQVTVSDDVRKERVEVDAPDRPER